MKNEGIPIAAVMLSLLLFAMLKQILFAVGQGLNEVEFLKQLLRVAAVIGIIAVLFKQNQDNDDLAGQV